MAFIVSRPGRNCTNYYVVFKDPTGKRTQKAAGTRRKDAEALKNRITATLADGKYGQQEEITFAAFADRWLTKYASVKVKPSTLKDYEGVVHTHLVPFFGKSLLSRITPAQVQDYVGNKVEKEMAPRTINKTVTVLKMMFKHAMRWEYLKENPARFVERPRQCRREMDYLNPDELRMLLDVASPKYFELFATAALTGARQGELLALRWKDIDLGKRIIYIRRTYHPDHGFTEPKTRQSMRAVLFSNELAAILGAYQEQHQAGPDDLVFRNRSGNPLNAQNMVTREFHPALEKAGLRRVRFHDLRHTYAALLISNGENIKFIQKQLGHSTLTTTMDTYGHLLPEVSERFGDRLDSLVFSPKVLPFPASRSSQSHQEPRDGVQGV